MAALYPQPDVPSTVRRLPTRTSATTGQESAALAATPAAPVTPAPPARVVDQPTTSIAPLTPERFKIQLTVSRETHDRLRHAQNLMRHTLPSGDTAVIFEHALVLLVAELERKKVAQTERPGTARATSPRSRHIPAAVRRVVWQRDGGRCAFRGAQGRCTETGRLEFHHVKPFAAGGNASLTNIELRCRAHNLYEADDYFGIREPLISWEMDAAT